MNNQWKYCHSMVARMPFVFAGTVLAVIMSANTYATSVMQMNLAQLCDRAGQIFSGTVVSVEADRVEAGGGDLPVLRYRVRVDDSFKGQFNEEKGVRYAEFAMLGTVEQLKSQSDTVLPFLQQGERYLLMVAPAGRAGITSTVGLVQGAFTLSLNSNKEMMAVNGANNVGLFAGMNTGAPVGIARANPLTSLANHERGPIAYDALAEIIQQQAEAGR